MIEPMPIPRFTVTPIVREQLVELERLIGRFDGVQTLTPAGEAEREAQARAVFSNFSSQCRLLT